MSRSGEFPSRKAPRERPSIVAPTKRSRAAILLKRFAQVMASVWVGPRLGAYLIARSVIGSERAFLASSESLARIPGTRGVYCRQAFYRRTLASCGRDVYFGWMSTFSKPAATIGEGVYIGRSCTIGLASIGSDVMLADGVQVLSGRRQHALTNEAGQSHRAQPQTFERVQIGAGAWLGASSVIMADVGEAAVVGAGAVVVKPIPPRSVAAGVPARVLRRIGPAKRSIDR